MLKRDNSINQSKEGVILTQTNIGSRMDFRTPLANRWELESRPFLVLPVPFL